MMEENRMLHDEDVLRTDARRAQQQEETVRECCVKAPRAGSGR